MDTYEWDNIQNLFQEINKKCNYLILRNYEDIENGYITLEGHDDIDILCDNVKMLVKYMHAFPWGERDNGKIYKICFCGEKIKLHIFHVGDGYYAANWQKIMLEKRVLNPFGFYIMDKENYYYALAYHGLFQKRVFMDDYRVRLKDMAHDLGLFATEANEHIELLNKFMRLYGYKYTYPTDPGLYINFSGLPINLIHKNYLWKIRRFFMYMKNNLISSKIYQDHLRQIVRLFKSSTHKINSK
jgi:hypothetical protein